MAKIKCFHCSTEEHDSDMHKYTQDCGKTRYICARCFNICAFCNKHYNDNKLHDLAEEDGLMKKVCHTCMKEVEKLARLLAELTGDLRKS